MQEQSMGTELGLAKTRRRIQSIDIVRGAIMILMLLDHSRNYWTEGNGIDPVNLGQTWPLLFFTRWITHFCAPLFVFLTGVSAYVAKQGKAQTNLQSAIRLGSRGIWLIILELTLVSALWGMLFFVNGIQLQVIWAIGISLVILAFLQFLPSRVVGVIGLLIIMLHNLIPDLPPANSLGMLFWSLFHQSGFFNFNGYQVIALYPALPWIGVMALGYAMGELFTMESVRRKRFLHWVGGGAVLAFVVLRMINVYGDPNPFHQHTQAIFSVMDFINLQKYPPSLDFLLVTLGIGWLVLATLDKANWSEKNPLVVFGRTPLFFYLIHLAMLIVTVVLWFGVASLTKLGQPSLPFAYPLVAGYAVWVVLLTPLYLVCRRYYRLKFDGKARWWSYYL